MPRTNKLNEETVMPDPVGVTMEHIFQLIAKMDENNQKNMLAAIAEMKKPTAVEQEKLDKEAKRIAEQQQARLKLAEAEENRKRLMARGCQHATTHPGTGVTKHAWRAQVHTPANEKPYLVHTCMQCLTQTPRILATPEMLTQGVNLDQYVGLDFETLKNWAAKTQEAYV